MDLALRDIRRHAGKFVATIVGVGMLLTIVLVMNGIYQGNISDGVWLIENTAADLWVVEQAAAGRSTSRRGSPAMPTRASPRRPASRARARSSPTPRSARSAARASSSPIIGYDVFGGLGGPGRLARPGRAIEAPHYEMVADAQLGLRARRGNALGSHDYTVVGLTRGRSTPPAIRWSTSRCPTRRKCSTSRTTARSPRAAANLKRLERAGYSPEQPKLLPLLAGSLRQVNAVLVQVYWAEREACAGRSATGCTSTSITTGEERELDARGAPAEDVGGAGAVPQPARAGLDRDHRAHRLRAHDREDQGRSPR